MVTTTPTREEALKTLAQFMGPVLGPAMVLEQDWYTWVTQLFPRYVTDKETGAPIPFAPHQKEHWEWIWSVKLGVRQDPLVEIWPRGGAKSTSAELGVAALGARRTRRYCLYVSGTQEQADDHVQNIASMLESPDFARRYPSASQRLVGKYGSSKGWRRNRVRTASGFTVDAIGLDTAARGVKLEEARPDLIVLDDLDEELDSTVATDKKILTLSRKLLPAGSGDLIVLAIQNLVIPDGIFSRLAGVEGAQETDLLQNRKVLGPYPAIRNAQVKKVNNKYILTGGDPIWAGQDLKKCQEQIGDWGYSSWLVEAQQDVTIPPGGMFSGVDFESIHVDEHELPGLVRTVVWVDPAVTATDRSDSHGIQADSLGMDEKIYRQRSWEGRGTPASTIEKAITWAIELKADHVGVETDQGGDVWEIAYNAVWQEMVRSNSHILSIPSVVFLKGFEVALAWSYSIKPNFTCEKAGAGYGPKTHRASRMLVDYEHDVFRHVLGTHAVLERSLGRFPLRKPFDLTDAAFWCWNDLKQGASLGVGASDDSAPTAFSPSNTQRANTPISTPMGTIGVAGRGGKLWGGHGTRRVWHQGAR